MAEDDPLLTTLEVARALRVDITTVRRWIKVGALDAIGLPHKSKRAIYRVRKSTLDAVLMSTTLKATLPRYETRKKVGDI